MSCVWTDEHAAPKIPPEILYLWGNMQYYKLLENLMADQYARMG